MISNEVFGITFICLGTLIFVLKDRFYLYKANKYDVYGRWYLSLLSITIGIWKLLFVDIDNLFVKWVNTNYLYFMVLLV